MLCIINAGCQRSRYVFQTSLNRGKQFIYESYLHPLIKVCAVSANNNTNLQQLHVDLKDL